MILLALLLTVPPEMVKTHTPSRHMQPPPFQGSPHSSNNWPMEQSANFQQYLYNPSMPPMPVPQHQQQSAYQWNTNYNQQQPPKQQQPSQFKTHTRNGNRQLIDYPFTVEYVDRGNPREVGSSRNDRNLIDIPFTVEYVNRNENSGNDVESSFGNFNSNRRASSQSQTQPNFQFNNNQNPNFNRNTAKVYSKAATNCSIVRCAGGY